MSSCSDITPFWSLFPSFICRNHPFLLQRFWQTIRGYTRWEWLRRCLKAQPIWTLFPTVPFLNHHLMSTANVPYLPYTCPHFCLLPSTTNHHRHHHLCLSTSLSLFIFLYSPRLYFKGRWGNCVSNPIEVKTAQGRRQSLRKRWFVPERMIKCECVWSVGGWFWEWGDALKNDAKSSCWGKSTSNGIYMFDLWKVQKKKSSSDAIYALCLFYFWIKISSKAVLTETLISVLVPLCMMNKYSRNPALYSTEIQQQPKTPTKLIILIFQEINSSCSHQTRHSKKRGTPLKMSY